MELTIPERLSLLDILPSQGNAVSLRILQDLRMRLAFTEEEIKKWKITVKSINGGGSAFVTWDESFNAVTAEIPVGDVATDIIRRELMRLDQERRLRTDMLKLYERFVDGKSQDSKTEST